SFSEMALGLPPFTPLFELSDAVITLNINLRNYLTLVSDPFYASAYWNSLKIAFFSTLGCLLIGYPMAYCIARAKPTLRSLLLALVILPSWTSFLLRVYAWMGILQETGYLNQLLMKLHIISAPIQFLYTDFAIYLGIIYGYLPFMVLPIFVSIAKMDWLLLKAASDLGARPWTAFWRITLPLTLPGILTGSLLVFIPAVGEFVIPDLLGGSGSNMIGRVLWQEFFNNRDWPLSAALATLMLLLLLLPIYIFTRAEKNTGAV
ncbi:MAG TPA: ABC transporter permease subunit, partial [Gammaproteobacteria bacterium]|nr:ABC transporter permease subunit [Gammaproteobacteria bacterium]